MRNAVIYARVSSKEQEREGFSIPAQLKLLRDYARSKLFHVTIEFIDVESAGKSGRDDFNKMIATLRKEKEPVVLVEKTDRLYRNFKDYVVIEELNAEVHLVKEGVVLSKDSRSHDKLIHGFKVLMAKNFLDNLREETQKGMREKAEQGIWPSTAPVGYRNVTLSNGKRSIVPDPGKAHDVARLFNDYSTGRYSLRTLPRPSWTYPQHLKKLFDNPIYYGEFNWKGKRYNGTHEPIVSRQLWEQCQDVMRGHCRRTRTARKAFPFSGLIHCGHCGWLLIGQLQKGKYVYYHCKSKCPEPYVRQETLEAAFTREVERLSFPSEFIAELKEMMISSAGEQKTFQAENTKRLRQEYDRLQKRLEQAYVDKLDGRIDSDMHARLSEEWRSRQNAISAELSAFETSGRIYIDEGLQLLEICETVTETFGVQPATEKRKMLDILGLNYSWKAQTLTMQWRRPFDDLVNSGLSNKASPRGQKLNLCNVLMFPDATTMDTYRLLKAV